MPGESREHDRHVVDAQTTRLDQVLTYFLFVETIDPPRISKAAHGPRTDDVERTVDGCPFGVWARVAGQRAPPCGYASEQRHPIPGIGIVPEELDELGGLVGRWRAIDEAKTPDGQQWPAAMMEVARTVREVERVHEVDPIALHGIDDGLAGLAGDVVT